MTKLDVLREIAMDQHGYVTTAEALGEGITHADLSKMVTRGRLFRAGHGVYRVPQIPVTEFDQYRLALLWSGVDGAVLSHDTALQAWEISDINPARIHLTVPRGRRLRRTGGDGYIIHYEDIVPGEVTWWQELPVTDVPTTIAQCIRSGVPTYLLRQAIDRAGRGGQLDPERQIELVRTLEERDGRR
ncbi:type IV toxin-antitoxin system AbiEi family antitoxin domain-containing protein [Leucobacter sp. HY1908]